ncbi:hypothetical protein Celaphus_00017171 [Cervus elaphus hippelaphus]|uniref:Beta-retroviral matrix protein domain-containing protein n=1 Tax=Cervus elaphus hippelaphus TaxID=46360 RepID=A0A212CMZ4_CEREH|nr:hypothetical protein Celaphus_00017171 [Cervus elaphus hippelaphus]
MGQMVGKPHHFSTLLYHLFKVQGFLVKHLQIEACLQTVVECNPWFPEEGSFDLEIWRQVKENVKRSVRQGKNILIDFWPLWALTEVVILPLQEGTYPKVSPSTEPNDSDNDSLMTPFSIKTDNSFLNNNSLPAF